MFWNTIYESPFHEHVKNALKIEFHVEMTQNLGIEMSVKFLAQKEKGRRTLQVLIKILSLPTLDMLNIVLYMTENIIQVSFHLPIN